MSPTRHAVLRTLILIGRGILPAFTLRHTVAADNPYNAQTIAKLIKAQSGVLLNPDNARDITSCFVKFAANLKLLMN